MEVGHKPINVDRTRAPELSEQLAKRFPDLGIDSRTDGLWLRGSFPVWSDTEILDRFLIEVCFPPEFPTKLPMLREVGGRIPWTLDRHIYPSSGVACLFVPEEWFFFPEEQRTILGFLDGPVRNFFLGQSLVERGDPWPFGERSHGAKGLVESYGEILRLQDFGNGSGATLRHLLVLLSKDRIKGHWPCPCGSASPLRRCHLREVRGLQERVPPEVAKQALARLDRESGNGTRRR